MSGPARTLNRRSRCAQIEPLEARRMFDASVTGVVFHDLNRNGVREAGEPGLAGMEVGWDANNDGNVGSFTAGSNAVVLAPAAIPNGGVLSRTIEFNGTQRVRAMEVSISITHTANADLKLELVSPAGTRVLLAQGLSGAGLTNTTFSGSAATVITAGAAPYTGTFRPVGDLGVLLGESFGGTWKIEVTDQAGGGSGSVTSASLGYQAGDTVAVTDAGGVYTLPHVAAGTRTFMLEHKAGYNPVKPATRQVLAQVVDNTTKTAVNFAVRRDRPYILDDFDGDERSDVFMRDPVAGTNSVWTLGPSVVADKLTVQPANPNWRFATTGDFNADGKTDLVWRNIVTGQNAIWLMNGVALKSVVALPKNQDLQWQAVAAGDFNQDGKCDLLWRNDATGANTLWLMNQTAVAGFKALPPLANAAWRIQAAGDYDNDGDLDILWRNVNTSKNGVWKMTGLAQHVFKALPDLAGGAGWRMAGLHDWDGDGIENDLLWHKPADDSLVIWQLNNETIVDQVAVESFTPGGGHGGDTDR